MPPRPSPRAFGETASAHHLALLDGGHVEAGGVLHLAQPAALGWVVGEVDGLEEEVVIFDGAGLGFNQFESRVGTIDDGAAVGACLEYPLACLDHSCGVELVRCF